MSNGQARIPRPVERGEQARAHDPRLSSIDAFVLARIDGALDEVDLAALTGIDEMDVRAALIRLESLGLIAFDGRPKPAPAPAPSPAAKPALEDSGLSPEDRDALAEEVDLDVDLRKRLLAAHRRIDTADHYGILGVDKTADRKAIKRAYFELAAAFHPDRYFRKSLGSFKLRLEAVFSRATTAHDTLSNREKRAEYDAYLEERRRSRGIEELLADALAEVQRANRTVEREVLEKERVAPLPSPVPQVGPVAGVPAVPRNPTVVPVAPAAPMSASETAARRDALARRLLGGRIPARPTMPPKTAPPHASTPADAIDALRRRYEDRIRQAKTVEARKYAAEAEIALRAGNTAAAANGLRVAMNLAPHDLDLARRARDAQARSDEELGATYARQAQYEEKNARWPEAARSWARVCTTRPRDARAHERAANAALRSGGDIQEAVRLAARACELDPASTDFRVTLAQAYLAGGMLPNARRELETAALQAPHDGTILAMIKRLDKLA